MCTAISAAKRRRKRFIEFPGTHDDIDYAIQVLFEAQFKWSPQIEQEIVAKHNASRGHQNFSRHLVLDFHEQFRQIIGDGRIKHGFHFDTNPSFEPTCEQPTNAVLDPETKPKEECITSFSKCLRFSCT